jgi:hypothetical protein
VARGLPAPCRRHGHDCQLVRSATGHARVFTNYYP